MSEAWAELRLVGPRSRDVLSQLCALDFAPSAFANHMAKQTSFAKTTQLIVRRDISALPAFSIIGARSLAAFVWDTLLHIHTGHAYGIAPIGRNAMGKVIRVSVDVWESVPEAFQYHDVGSMALVSDVQAQDIDSIYERQQRGGYRSSLVSGEDVVFQYMRGIFPDWKAHGLTRCLHEHQGGFVFNTASMFGLAKKAEAEGAQILSGVEVTGFECNGDG